MGEMSQERLGKFLEIEKKVAAGEKVMRLLFGSERRAFYRWRKRGRKAPARTRTLRESIQETPVCKAMPAQESPAVLPHLPALPDAMDPGLDADERQFLEAFPEWSTLPEITKNIIRAGVQAAMDCSVSSSNMQAWKIIVKALLPDRFEESTASTRFTPNEYAAEMSTERNGNRDKFITYEEKHRK